MGMYNAVFGDGQRGYPLLAVLGFEQVSDVGRYRDAWVEKGEEGGYRIAVYTRNGGNNREEYMPDFLAHPYYLRDQDDEYDNTYATIYFSCPPELYAMVMAAEAEGVSFPGPIDMSQEWQKAIQALEDNMARREEVASKMDQYVKVVSIDPATGEATESSLSGLVEELSQEPGAPKE
jgi:hypothetical protein